MGTSARFLIVEDEPLVARSLARVVNRNGKAVVAHTAQEADRALTESVSWSGLIIDVGLPDGSGLEVLSRARQRHALTPALILTGRLQEHLINRAYDLRALYLVKPAETDRLRRFIREAITAPAVPQEAVSLGIAPCFAARVGEAARAWAVMYRLTGAETDILTRAARGEDRDTIATTRGCSEQTINKHVTNLLARTGDRSLHIATERLLRGVAGER